MMAMASKTTKELADRNAVMLRDTEACPSAPLQDNTIEIQERFDAALAALIARIQSEVTKRYKDFPPHSTLEAPRIEAAPARKGQRFIRVMEAWYVREVVSRSRIVGFVEVGTGLMWKAATRNAPALNYPRGCIFDLDAIRAGELGSGSFDSITTKIDLG